MQQKGQTKDEMFMKALYREAVKLGSESSPIDRYVIGHMVGMQKTAIDTICKTLLRVNFIKKHGDDEIYLTPQGIRLLEDL
jgi:predicted transcriptional regulator